jgi:hypothetical protein
MCLNQACVRKSCTADSDCGPMGLTFCVEGQCYDGQGRCEQLPQ